MIKQLLLLFALVCILAAIVLFPAPAPQVGGEYLFGCDECGAAFIVTVCPGGIILEKVIIEAPKQRKPDVQQETWI